MQRNAVKEVVIVKEVVQKNAFFAHPDQLLLAICAYKNELIRRDAVNKIRNLKTKSQHIPETDKNAFPAVEKDGESLALEKTNNLPSKNIRKIIFPKLKFEAIDYHHVIDWDSELKIEPPFLASLSDEKFYECLKTL